MRITQCITDAKGDRSRRPGNQDDPDAYVRIVLRAHYDIEKAKAEALRSAQLDEYLGQDLAN